MRKWRIFWAFGLAVLALGPAGCGRSEDAPEAEGEGPWSDPDAPAGITVADARMTLPAVAGNPGSLYFTLRNAGIVDQTIRSVWISGAGSGALHETRSDDGVARMSAIPSVAVPAGRTIAFAPGGLHVMVDEAEAGDVLEVGGLTEATVTFASGDKVSFPVEIRGPGDAGAAHAGMDHAEGAGGQ